jgi:hypothetical protein
MAINHPKAGANSVPAYQLSGVPFVTSSAGGEVQTDPIEITFPYVTRFFMVQNTSANPMRIGFTADGVDADITANYLVLSGNDMTPRLELRCKSLFFRNDGAGNCSFSLVAGLSTIESNEFPVLTGSVDGTSAFEGVG